MAAEGNSARLLATDQNILVEHVIGDVIEADRRLVNRQGEPVGKAVDHACGRDRAHNRAAPAAHFHQIAQCQGHDLVWIDEVAALVHGSNAVSVAVGRQPQVSHPGADRAGQRTQVSGDRFGVHAAESRVHLPADFPYLATGAFQDALDHTTPGAVHRIDHHALRVIGDGIEIDHGSQMVVICWQRVEALQQPIPAGLFVIHQVRAAAALLIIIQVNLNPAALLFER